MEVTHVNLNDGTVEGLAHRRHPAFCVQYHPEVSAGPHDSSYLFARFREMLGLGPVRRVGACGGYLRRGFRMPLAVRGARVVRQTRYHPVGGGSLRRRGGLLSWTPS
ncbi:MAG: hypothetical protein JW809_08830 [Pirellulales bacterium]|nr:hypothetical protein [Pirellulales bacterium]